MKKYVFPAICLLGSLIFAYMYIDTAIDRKISRLEGVLLQFLCLGLGCWASYLFTALSCKNNALAAQKPYCRSAFRRLYSLFTSMSRVKEAIQKIEENETTEELAIVRIDAIVTEQLQTVDDALEDWNEIIPDTVSELREKLENRSLEK